MDAMTQMIASLFDPTIPFPTGDAVAVEAPAEAPATAVVFHPGYGNLRTPRFME